MSQIEAKFVATDTAFRVEGYENIEYDLLFVEGVFNIKNRELADSYQKFGRCLMVVDATVHRLYQAEIEAYFKHYEIDLTVFPIVITELDKSLRTLEKIVKAIKKMLELEAPNLHELDLDRVIAYGHTWSPTFEQTPEIPLDHGHAVNIDIALSATLAAMRGYITPQERDRILTTMNNIGLALDNPVLDINLLWKAGESITKTRDGLLRAAVPRPIGTCFFVNDLEKDELEETLAEHRRLCADYPDARLGTQVYMNEGKEETKELLVGSI